MPPSENPSHSQRHSISPSLSTFPSRRPEAIH
jgi:hypothetical protein